MTEKVRKQILMVRDDGRSNMFDVNGVMVIANELRLYELVVYLDDRDNRSEYANFIMTGEAEITEDEDGAEAEDSESSKPSHEEQLEEAVRRLKLFFPESTIPEEFAKDESLYVCQGTAGLPVRYPEEMIDEICEFENEYEAIVYLVIRNSWSDSLLFVSRYRDEWEDDYEDIEDGYPMAYVINRYEAWCSEFGSIRVRPVGDSGYIRIS